MTPRNKRVNIIYISVTGNTEKMLEAAAEGAREAGAEVRMIKADESVGLDDVINCDAMVWGGGNYYGYMEGLLKHWYDCYHTPMKKVVKKGGIPWRPYFNCASAGRGGGKHLHIMDYLNWGMNLKKTFDDVVAFWAPTEELLALCRENGRQLVEIDGEAAENLYVPSERQLKAKSDW
jgi:multimeric flavodoxin WrbA